VPGGWWHAVLNLDNTIAVTENFCNSGNFEKVWLETRKGRKKLSCKWLALMKKLEPALY
jgi:histone arginine demethylase JMJD6